MFYHGKFDYSFFLNVNIQVVTVWETTSGKAVAERRWFFWFVWFLVFFFVVVGWWCCAFSQTILICCCSRLLDHAVGSMGCYCDQSAASTKPQQLNSNGPARPGVLLTPARCGWPAGGRWKGAQAGLDFGLLNEESPSRNGFIYLLPRATTTTGSGKNSEDADKGWVLLTSHYPREREGAWRSERGQKHNQRGQIAVDRAKGCTKLYIFGCKILELYLNIYSFLKGSSYSPVRSIISYIKWGSGLNALCGWICDGILVIYIYTLV